MAKAESECKHDNVAPQAYFLLAELCDHPYLVVQCFDCDKVFTIEGELVNDND